MLASRALLALRVAVLTALATSVALALDYASGEGSFCAAGSGCQALRRSDFTLRFRELTGLELPTLGVVAFASLYVLSLLPQRQVRRLALPLIASLGGLSGVALLVTQAAVVGVFCSLCVVVDAAAVLAGVAAWLARATPERKEPVWRWPALGALAVASPLLHPGWAPVPPPPPEVRALFSPDRVDVVEFADFECPHCRRLHPRLKALLASYGDRVRFVRQHAPLSFHPLARGAALATLCAEQQGRGEALADVLFATDDLSPAGLRRHVVGLGLDVERHDACMAGHDAQRELERHLAAHRATGLGGVPLTYVEERVIRGGQPDEVFRDAIDRALRGERRFAVPLWLHVLGTVVLALLLLIFPRGRDGSAARGSCGAPAGGLAAASSAGAGPGGASPVTASRGSTPLDGTPPGGDA